MSQSLKKTHQTTKKNLLQTFSDLINKDGGVSVERLLLLTNCLEAKEQDLPNIVNIVKQNFTPVQQEQVESVDDHTQDFCSRMLAEQLCADYPFFKDFISELGVFTFSEIVNALKDKLEGGLPHITIGVSNNDFCKVIVNHAHVGVSPNLQNALIIALSSYRIELPENI